MVIDISGKKITEIGITTEDIFLLDSNILFWLYAGYPVSTKDKGKVKHYSSFIAQLISNNNLLWTSAGNVQEVLNIVEKNEFDLYKNNGHQKSNKKDYRNNLVERKKLEKKEQAIYGAISSSCDIKRLVITDNQNKKFVDTYSKHIYDPMDFFITQNAYANGRVNVVTDDRDFRKDNRMKVFTVV